MWFPIQLCFLARTFFTLFDHNGTIVARYPDPEQWVGQSASEAPIFRAILAQQREGTAEAPGLEGVPRLFAFTPLRGVPEGSEVYVTVGIPAEVAFAEVNRIVRRNLTGLGVVIALALVAASLGQGMIRNSAAVFVWTAVLRRTMSKYGHRGLRYIFLDAGHICQNLLLAAEALGLGACPVAAFFDRELNSLLGVDGEEESAIYMAVVGRKNWTRE